MPPRRAVTGRSQEPRQRFVEELRLLRAQKGDSLRQLGDVLGWDWSLFGKMESGQTLGSPEVAQALDQHYGTPGLLLTLWELAVADPTQFKERYRRYMTLEAEALSLWHYAVSVLPGLLQTEGYAHDVLVVGGTKGEELTRQVEARVGRRKLLMGDEAPPFRTILSEAVLRTPLDDAEEWRKQLAHLAEAAERPNLTLQVLPHDAGPHGLVSTAVMFLRLPDGRTVAYTENAHRGELIEETSSVERLQRAYDAVRDLALSPAESRKFVMRMLEEVPCEPST
ncbi:helix-turn-helix domain-containing protein [Streptomyces sp. Je 1-4]|uniref:helix-turn-helix domain-containing protein n=1 Tax=Streptomyces TaxID=1883 RepID=UPI0021DA4A9D|nr:MULTISPECIES: helix-turn-helix transcriptional regulator [unclassified Streptomyces]UYB40715.1 helix-turn-helix domain-containing protein [Streptomyces sp. Je 1-4]UZQ36858.1 helix-turn-helix domain-containing protein [Streptomyces sp. Je 1-4] [Streptomyces sp. Je 1-4 4N24]UZQ44275.1 helix-turn-helix domain-containing protein [Streptomyces sp. Je 1-4] [Streptomyces sp. Je 1-4 4N24_ara]